MRLLLVLLPLLVVIIGAFAPAVTHAADFTLSPNFHIIPEECHCPESAPDFGCVLAVMQNVVNFVISLGFIIFVLVLCYAGFLFMTNPTNSHARETGNHMITNAVVGILLMLSAWLIVDFVMSVLYNKAFGPWNSILTTKADKTPLGPEAHCVKVVTPSAGAAGQVQTGTPGGVTATPGGQTGTSTQTSTSTQATTGTTGTEAAVRARLTAAGISVNNPDACPAGETYQAYRSRTGRRCTTVGGLTGATINHAISMASHWGGFQITGGSEAGHATHGGGNRFDAIGGIGSHIRSLPAATAAQIQASQIRAGTTGVYADACGNTYLNEDDHWHITVFSTCSNL